MSKIEPPKDFSEVPITVIKNMITLAASGFGLVVALAWNELIRSLVDEYIAPFLGKEGGVISLFVYAVVVTFLAVFTTMQLTRVQHKLEEVDKKIKEKIHH